MRLIGRENAADRAHFFAAVAREMRHLLVDYARARNAKKHADGNVRISLNDVDAAADARDEDLVALDEAHPDWKRSTLAQRRVVELIHRSERTRNGGPGDLDLDAQARLEPRESVLTRCFALE